MNVHDLLTEADIEQAPEPPDDAFVYLVTVADGRLSEAVSRLSDDEDDWRAAQAMYYAFMNVVVALAKSYSIDAFSEHRLPGPSAYKGDGYIDFRADLDHFLTQQLVVKTQRARRDSIVAYPAVKERIRTHLHHIKEQIDKAELPESRRAKLHERLAEFEKALEKDRLSVLAIGRVTLEVISLAANVMTVSDSQTLHKLLSNMMVTVGVEKAEQAASNSLTASDLPRLEVQPSKRTVISEETVGRGYGGRGRESFPAVLDDEIPF